MTPRHRQSSSGGFNRNAEPRPGQPESTLKTGQIQIERKLFVFSLRQNSRGRFLRVTEDVGGRFGNIIIPATGLEEFRRVLDEMVKAAGEPWDESHPHKSRQP